MSLRYDTYNMEREICILNMELINLSSNSIDKLSDYLLKYLSTLGNVAKYYMLIYMQVRCPDILYIVSPYLIDIAKDVGFNLNINDDVVKIVNVAKDGNHRM